MQSDSKQNKRKDFIFLPYRTTATVNDTEESLLQKIRFRANAIGYEQPVLRESDSGEKELVLYQKRTGIQIGKPNLPNIKMNLSELNETGQVSICCWESLSGTISFFVVLVWFILADIFVIYKSYAEWDQIIPFYIALAAAHIGLFLMYYFSNRRTGKRVLDILILGLSVLYTRGR